MFIDISLHKTIIMLLCCTFLSICHYSIVITTNKLIIIVSFPGFNRRSLPDPSDATNPAAHWDTRNGSMDPTTIQAGYWAPGQPNPSDGACAMAMEDMNAGTTVAGYR